VSGEGALAISGDKWHASAGGFWTVVEDAIANVTIQFTPTIIRERRNAGEAHARGLELDFDMRPISMLTLRASALVVDSKFRESLEPALEGKWLPQVPKYSVAVSGDAQITGWAQASFSWRGLSTQFDDDRNVFQTCRGEAIGSAAQAGFSDARLRSDSGELGGRANRGRPYAARDTRAWTYVQESVQSGRSGMTNAPCCLIAVRGGRRPASVNRRQVPVSHPRRVAASSARSRLKPAAAVSAFVVVFPSDNSKWIGDAAKEATRLVATSGGRFSVTGLPPGDYRVGVVGEASSKTFPDAALFRAPCPRRQCP
jgi:hypothetical protein